MNIDHFTPADWARHNPSWFQRLVRWGWSRPGRIIYRYRGYGAHPRVPTEGGFLMAPGPHGAFVDPFIYALGQRRTRLRFMAKHHVFEWFVAGRMIRWAGGFPVYRGGNRSAAALEIARTVVESGDGIAVFMEGRLELDHTGLGTPRNGLARLALATGAPVIPAAAWGSKRARAYGKRWWYHWPRVTVVWGEQIQFPKEDDPSEERVAQVRDEVWARVHVCFEQAKAIAHAPGRRPGRGTSLEQALAKANYQGAM